MTASRLVRVTILVALLFLAATRLFARPITPVVTIKTLADTTTLIPSGSGNFIAFDPAPLSGPVLMASQACTASTRQIQLFPLRIKIT